LKLGPLYKTNYVPNGDSIELFLTKKEISKMKKCLEQEFSSYTKDNQEVL